MFPRLQSYKNELREYRIFKIHRWLSMENLKELEQLLNNILCTFILRGLNVTNIQKTVNEPSEITRCDKCSDYGIKKDLKVICTPNDDELLSCQLCYGKDIGICICRHCDYILFTDGTCVNRCP